MILGYTLISYAVKKSKTSKDAEMSCPLVNRRNCVCFFAAKSHHLFRSRTSLRSVLNQGLLILQHDASYLRAFEYLIFIGALSFLSFVIRIAAWSFFFVRIVVVVELFQNHLGILTPARPLGQTCEVLALIVFCHVAHCSSFR